ncbi:MAG: hypothetical protein JXB48_07530 [Candidatus Latescibacteria bacterium]|nr:hypothetical protein [Candidatus Latescibacterota bacterium]
MRFSKLIIVCISLILITLHVFFDSIVQAESPVLYHVSFENFDFLEDDILEHAGWRTIESRNLSLTAGRFGKGLHLGNVPEPFDLGNASSLGMNMYNVLLRMRNYRGSNWSGPFIWSGNKINPSGGTVSFWIHGELTPQWKLFYQTTSSFGRVERDLIVVMLDRNSHLSGYIVDARYDRHEIVTDNPVTGDGWKHVVFTWDKTSGLNLYLNGDPVASNDGNDAWWMNIAPGIYHLPSGGCTYDELYIFDRPLKKQDVRDLYENNRPPDQSPAKPVESSGSGARLSEKSGISTSLDLPVATPSDGERTLLFEDLWNDRASDGYVPGWWVNDGRYMLAWPHPYAFWTITIGDMDFHAQQVDLGIPAGKTVNYITLEGNLEGVKVLALEDDRGIDTKTLLDVPAAHGFFYGSLVSPVTGQKLRIPFVKEWGTPEYYKGDVNLPLTGNTRLHEVGLFNVRESRQPSGTALYLTKSNPGLDKARYGFALKALADTRDSIPITVEAVKPKSGGSYYNTGAFRRLNIFSGAWRENTGIDSICLNFYVRTRSARDVLLVRLRDPAVPSRIWSHAEIKLQGFDRNEPALLSLTLDITDLVCAQGDRMWLDVCSADGAEILIGDSTYPSSLTVVTMPVKEALAEYSRKEIYAAEGEFSASQEYPLWLGKVHTDFLTPKVWSGIFDKVYFAGALGRVDPDYAVGQYIRNFGSGRYYYSSRRNPQTDELYTIDNYPEKWLQDIDIPGDAPAWAAWMRAYRQQKFLFSNHWMNHQNPDGQFGGGYNDDTTHMITGEFESALDGNDCLLNTLNLCRDGFDKTRLYQDGYQVLYPMDRHHTRDPVRQYNKIVAMNLGGVHEIEYAMEVGWHHGFPERTPMHYSEGIPFEASHTAVLWYWGLDRPDKPYTGPDEKTLLKELRFWYSSNDSTIFWHNTRSYKEFGTMLVGSGDFYNYMLGCSETTYPHMSHAVSWPKGGGIDVSRWVEYADDISLKTRIYSFHDSARTLTARFYRLKNGKYSIVLAPDNNNDGQPDGNPTAKLLEIRRFSDIELNIESRTPLVLDIRQVESYGDPGPLPDLALDPEDIRISGTFITVTVHNIGNAPANNIPVILYADGKQIETKTIEHIDAPVDFVPKFHTLYFTYKSEGEKIKAVLDPDSAIDEIFELNNHAEAADNRANNYFDWSDVPYVE